MIDWLNIKKMNNIELAELTNNTVILFRDEGLLYKFKMQLSKIIEDINNEDVDFSLYDDAEDVNIQTLVSSNEIGIYDINHGEQQITLGMDKSLVFMVDKLDDLWFVGYDENDKIICYALSEFEEYDRYKNDNIRLYKAVAQGKFICME